MPNDEFKREERYIVFKVKDALAHLSTCQLDRLQEIGETVAAGRSTDGKQPLNVVVVEQDWPEFEPTWVAIEARMTGRAIKAEVLHAQEPAAIDKLLNDFAITCAFGSADERVSAATAIKSLFAAPQPPAPYPKCDCAEYQQNYFVIRDALTEQNKELYALQAKVADQAAKEFDWAKANAKCTDAIAQQAERIAELEEENINRLETSCQQHAKIMDQAALIEKCYNNIICARDYINSNILNITELDEALIAIETYKKDNKNAM